MDMLKIKSKIPEKGLRHNGLFSIFLDEDEERGKNGVDDDDVVVSAPPPLQLERDVVRSLLYLAARNGSSELAEEALNMFSGELKEYSIESFTFVLGTSQTTRRARTQVRLRHLGE